MTKQQLYFIMGPFLNVLVINGCRFLVRIEIWLLFFTVCVLSAVIGSAVQNE